MAINKWILLWMNFIIVFYSSSTTAVSLTHQTYDKDSDFYVINFDDSGKEQTDHHFINKREITKQNITTKVSHLRNAFQQQLLVHWSGQGSNVMLCLAKNSNPLIFNEKPTPSGVYISYDYGSTFENKTEFFKIDKNTYASIETFFSHKTERRFMMFLDKFNKILFLSKDYGKQFTKRDLSFKPSDVLVHPETPYIFLVYSSNRTLYITRDFGETFTPVQELVKSYFWAERWKGTWGDTPSRTLLLQRIEPGNSTTAIALLDIDTDNPEIKVIKEDVEQFLISGDFLLATKSLSPTNKELYISYQGKDFYKAQFDSELESAAFLVADVTESRILVAVAHTETLSNLYVSEFNNGSTKYSFRLSLERLFCYFPNIMWKSSWLSDVTDAVFADVYKVQGMEGIYLASQVAPSVASVDLSPVHLTSVISFDWGGEWRALKPPQFDERGHPYNCNQTNGCSLHITQKFSFLYPVTRYFPILSSSSAPGIIVATGTVGKSLKDHAGIFISRDAGLSWIKVLRENYLFNMGDHGGILTAVKSFKSFGETNEILYSLDEGETWERHIFYKNPIRVYGLMTEPGENTTVFTVFGSEPSKHEWLIVNIDLRNAFKRNCTKQDFKAWYPSSSTSVKMACVMGKKETYERRLRHAKCYTGLDYDRPISTKACMCDIEDYECDVGFMRHVSSPDCVRNKSDTVTNPYKVPDICHPGDFYNRTKGYRKIDGDICYGGFERNYLPDKLPCPYGEKSQFLLVSEKNKIIRVDLTNPKRDVIPVKDLRNVIAIDFDMKNNCVYFADIVLDKIGRQCLTSGTDDIEYLVESNMRSVEGIAVDWISNMLYFVDGQQATIEVIRTDINHSGRMRKTVLNKTVLYKPRGIALHLVAGYMFWTDWSIDKPSVSRANLDGSNVIDLFKAPQVEWPNGITVDHIAERIYWVDAKLDYIASANLEGQYMRKTIKNLPLLTHPFSVAVFKDNIYWDDWTYKSIFSTDKDTMDVNPTIHSVVNLSKGLMDLKVFAHSIQEGTNACNNSSDKCSHLCFALPNNKKVCSCPDGMAMIKDQCMCIDGTHPNPNNTCPKVARTCGARQFSCKKDLCIPKLWVCDGENDCGDSSDEENCNPNTCVPSMFQCKTGKCIPPGWHCDFEKDCEDNSDEEGCEEKSCKKDEHQCKNKNCIPSRWVCDGEDDCKDGSDEASCQSKGPNQNCSEDYFRCGSTNQYCIPKLWVCDGESDCPDKLDELHCNEKQCEEWQFKCKKSSLCIFRAWKCDGVIDCGKDDNSDEENCTTVTPKPNSTSEVHFKSCKSDKFLCANMNCIPSWWKCDKINDCGDNSDEIGCPTDSKEIIVHPVEPKSDTCSENHFQCEDGECIQQNWVCDGVSDCSSGDDEINCKNVLCKDSKDSFRCKISRSCILRTQVCDGIKQCPDGTDEENCNLTPVPEPVGPTCSSGFFSCDGSRCLPLLKICDGILDCYDSTDESDCVDSKHRVYQVQQMSVDEVTKNETAIPLHWWIKLVQGVKFEFLPSISESNRVKNGEVAVWKNHTDWIDDMFFTFENLYPGHTYNMTVYVRTADKKKVFPPSSYLGAKTLEALPTPPWNLSVVQKTVFEVELKWRPPTLLNGQLHKYIILSTPPIPPTESIVSADSQTATLKGYFNPGMHYSFWIVAVNGAGQSNTSNVVNLVSDTAANVQEIKNLKEDLFFKSNETCLALMWDHTPNVEGYKIVPVTSPPYANMATVITNENHFIFTNLAPGVEYVFHVNAYYKSFDGPKSIITLRTKGIELPVVPGLSVEVSKQLGTSAKFHWDMPKSSRKVKWIFGIYYATTSKELMEDAKLITSNFSATVHNLEACSYYLADISVIAPLGQGPLSAAPLTFMTGYNVKAPPKKLKVSSHPHNDTVMEISWRSSCVVMGDPIGYELSIHEQIYDQKSYFTLVATNKTSFSHSIIVEYGARYEITVHTELGIPSKSVEYWAPSLPTPHQVQVQFEKEKTDYIVYWNLHSHLQSMPKHSFEVLVSEGSSLNLTVADSFVTDKSPYRMKNMKSGTIYSFGVRVLSESGYRSPVSEVVSIFVPFSAWASVMTPTSVVSFIIPFSLVLLVVIVIFIVLIVRYRRLQNSFSSFANSHYSTRSGAATFTSDGLDDEDSPVIRGFSDDEPLVVA